MDDIEKVAEDLHDLLNGPFGHIEMRDKTWKSTVVPKDARFFAFDYTDLQDDAAVINIGLFTEKSMKVFIDHDIVDQMDDDQRQRWYKFLKRLRMGVANPHRFSFDLVNFTKGKMDLRHMIQQTKDVGLVDKADIGKMTESKMFGSSRSSYQTLESVRIVVRHSKRIEEGDGRSRNIEAIFIENGQGERFRVPDGTSLNGARAYARHIKNGGQMHDELGEHIGKIITEMNALKVFVRNTRGRQFEDAETSSMVEAAIDHYGSLHRDLFTMRGQRGYQQYKDLWQPEQPLTDEIDIDALRERFTRRVFDERLDAALPIVHRVYKTKQESIAEEFESWANQVIESEDEVVDDSDVNINIKSPFANSEDSGAAKGENDIDGGSSDESIDGLLERNGFEYQFQDGKYWLESKQEIERAKDIIAANAPGMPFPPMAVYAPGQGTFGASTFDRELPNGKGVMEDMDQMRHLAGLTK